MSFFGQNIRFLRNKAQLSQTAFAELFNLKRAAVGAYEEERAEPKVEVFVMIARHFGVPVEDLICKNMQENESQPSIAEGLQAIPYLDAENIGKLRLSYDEVSAQAPRIIIPPVSGKNLIAVQYEGNVLIVSEITDDEVEKITASHLLGVRDDDISILASSPHVVSFQVFHILHIIKEYHSAEYTDLMIGKISRKLKVS